jgi:hypothetical protein
METNNIINILKQALKFYANENNYSDGGDVASIDLDKGNHARFALEQAKKIEDIMDNAEDEFVKNISNDIEMNVDSDKIINLIEKYKNDNGI